MPQLPYYSIETAARLWSAENPGITERDVLLCGLEGLELLIMVNRAVGFFGSIADGDVIWHGDLDTPSTFSGPFALHRSYCAALFAVGGVTVSQLWFEARVESKIKTRHRVPEERTLILALSEDRLTVTIDQLAVSREALECFERGELAQGKREDELVDDDRIPNGYSERWAVNREPVLRSAIHLLTQEPAIVTDTPANAVISRLRKRLEQRWTDLNPGSEMPPLSTERLERLLSECVNRPVTKSAVRH